MQVIDDPGFASQLGTGIAGGLQNLLNMKMQDMARKKQSSAMESLGLPPGMAEIDPKVLQQFLKNQQTQKQMDAVSKTFSDDQEIQPVDQQQNSKPGAEGAVQPGAQPVQAQPSKASRLNRARKLENAALVAPADVRKDYMQMAKAIRQEISEEKKEAKIEQRETDKETLPIYKETIRKYKDSRENDQRIGRMERLVEKGDLGDPTFNSFLETLSQGVFGFGINMKSLMSADAQEFDKLSTEFLKGAKELFGARVTDNEIKMFMKMVPTLTQSDAGKMRVISNMRTANQANKIRRDAMRDIIKENKGKRPEGLEDLIENRIDKRLDRLALEFKRKIRPRELSTESVGFEGKTGEATSMLSPSRLLKKGRKALGSEKFGEASLSTRLFGF